MTSCWRHLRVIRTPCVLAALTLVGCATVKNTPQQDYTYEIGRNCETPITKIERVDPDGRYWILARGLGASTSSEYSKFFACMKDQFKAHPFLDWARAQKRDAAQPPVAVGSASVVASAPPSSVTAPVWHVGDEWQYAYQSPRGSGSFVWSVDREEVLDGVPFYVVKSGSTRELYYRKSDYAYHMDKVNGQVETRHTPPQAYFAWPLVPGAKVEMRYTRERPLERQTEDMVIACELGTVESVTVPAGTFDTVKLSCRNSRTNALTFEMWLSPAVKHMVRERTYFSYGVRERELISFRLR